MKSILVVILFLVSGTASVFGEDQLKVGQEALKKGDYLAAITALKDAVKSDKKNVQGYILLGTAYLKADSTDLAIATLIQARELDTANATIYMLLGDSYAKQNISAAAVEQYKKVSELDPKNIDAYLKLGDSYRRSRKYNEAANAFIRVLTLDSTNVTALHELSRIFARARQYANALPYAEKLEKMMPDSMTYELEYERDLYETKRWNDLIAMDSTILKVDGSLMEVQTHYAEALMVTGKIDKVVEAYSHVKLDSLSVNDLVRYARALKATNKFEESEKVFMVAYKKDSTRCDMFYDLSTLYMKLQKYREAISMSEKKMACDTASGYHFACNLNEAMCYLQLKNYDSAITHTKKSLDLRPDNVQAWMTLAQIFGLMETRPTDEIAAYKKVIEIGSNDVNEGKYTSQVCEANKMVGVRYLIQAVDASKGGEPNKEKYSACIEYLKKALPCNPKDSKLLLWIAQANQNVNNKDEAKKYYHKLIDYCPGTKDAEDAKKALEALGEK